MARILNLGDEQLVDFKIKTRDPNQKLSHSGTYKYIENGEVVGDGEYISDGNQGGAMIKPLIKSNYHEARLRSKLFR